MKWLQFITPAKSLDFNETNAVIAGNSARAVTILDVRQPSEYKQGHIPGATLIPLPQLPDRLSELDPDKPTLVYWAMGGRSRVAAQMLQARGFQAVFNVAGGINAWEDEIAVGPQDLGIDLFDGRESPLDILKVAYSLEQGLREFYVTMEAQAENEQVKNLFARLSDIEVKHQMAVYLAYCDISPEEITKEKFEKLVELKSMEGGLSTQEYLDLFQPDLESAFDVVSLAMSIEAQALDLYLRVGEKIKNPESRQIIEKIANEEKVHLASLGDLMEKL